MPPSSVWWRFMLRTELAFEARAETFQSVCERDDAATKAKNDRREPRWFMPKQDQ